MNNIPSLYQSPSSDDHGSPPSEEDVALRDYWTVIFRHRRAVVLFFFLVLVLTVLSIPWDARPIFTAKTILHIGSHTRDVIDTPELVTPGLNYFGTQLGILKSRSLSAEVVRNLGLQDNPAFTGSGQSVLSSVARYIGDALSAVVSWFTPAPKKPSQKVEFEFGVHPSLVDFYLNSLEVRPVAESELVDVVFRNSDPALAKAVADAHAAAFIQRNLSTRFELTGDVRQYLEKKLKELKINLEQSEKVLNDFQRTNKIVSLEKGENVVLDRLKLVSADLSQARARRIELESLYRVLQQGDNRLISQIIDNPSIQQMRSQITALELNLSSLKSEFKPGYPPVLALQKQIEDAKSRLDREISHRVQSIEKDYVAATAKEKALLGEAEDAKRVALDLREKSAEFAILEREVLSNRAVYEIVLKKIKESTVVGGGPIPNISIVDRAEIPVRPDPGKKLEILALGMVVGLLGGIGLAFLLDRLDDTLRTPGDVERFIQLPTLGIVPDVAKLANSKMLELGYAKKLGPSQNGTVGPGANQHQLMVAHHPLSLMGEMYRSICTAILFSRAEKPPQTILVTSAQPNEGKTVTAVNLSITLAQSSGPVLLIDADLHGGYSHRLLGLSNGTGLTNALTGDGEVQKFIKKTKVNNLSFLGRGTPSPNPADLLASEKMRQTLDALAAEFRFIVIDSAPVLPVSDTVLLSARIDGIVLVARGGQVSRQVVRKARARLDYVKAKIVGVVLNGVDISTAEYAEYRYIYRSHYTRYGDVEARTVSDEGAVSAKSMGDVIPAGVAAQVPAEVLEWLVSKLTEFVGPMAFIIVHDQIAALGESPEDFPRTRFGDLVDSVSREITNDTMRESFRKQIFNAVGIGAAVPPSARTQSTVGTVPVEFFERMVAVLTEFAGPMASRMVYDEIAALGESSETFPTIRLDELVKAVIPSILDETMKRSFQTQLSEEIRNFGLS